MSLNEFCARKLASPGGDVAGPTLMAIERAAAVLGSALLGIVAFGSWARDELAEGSDLDLLIIAESEMRITRELYHRWDVSPLSWRSLPVEPHFVHLPDPRTRVSGTWAEVALDGLVLFERGLAVSRLLADLRGKIAAGRLVRRRVHGQSYWIEAA